MNYDLLGDIIVALNSIDQAQSQFPRNSVEWQELGEIYKVLDGVDITPYHTRPIGDVDEIIVPTPYAFSGPFAYSLACALCRQEVSHTEGEHMVLSRGIEVQSC